MGLQPEPEKRIADLEAALFGSLEAIVEMLLVIRTGAFDQRADVDDWLSKYRHHVPAWQRTLTPAAVKRLLAERARAQRDPDGGQHAT